MSSRYLLDTDTCIEFLNGTSESVVEHIRSRRPADITLCSVVKAELLFGALNSERVEENLETLHQFFEPFESLAFDDAAAETYGQIRARLESSGNRIGPNDLQIAAIARSNQLTLVSHNTDEFSRVSDLNLEDWKSGG
ncbi:MAG: type II toxin-antitoxin system VapC family toxin [Bradymonadaceae bacterium]